jgi:hypothetical protein
MQYLNPRASIGAYTLPPLRLRGFGHLAGPTNLQLGEQGAGVAVSAAGAAIASGAAAASGATILGSTLLATAIPFVGPAIAAATIVIEAIMNSGCGQTCIESTSFANQANAALQQNIEAYFQPRMVSGKYDPTITLTTESQAASVGNFNRFWQWLVTQCSNSQLGTAGQKCISDRQRGSCKWTQPASSVPPWGSPAAGQCWDWFVGYLDPIANDTNVAPGASLLADPTAGTSPAGATTGGASPETLTGGNSSLILWGGAALLLVGLMSGGRN